MKTADQVAPKEGDSTKYSPCNALLSQDSPRPFQQTLETRERRLFRELAEDNSESFGKPHRYSRDIIRFHEPIGSVYRIGKGQAKGVLPHFR
jgi:hypothetical protein